MTPALVPSVPVVDLTRLSSTDRERRILEIRAEMRGRLFSIGDWPSIDVRLCLMTPGEARLLLAVDMLVADAPSVAILLEDLSQAIDKDLFPEPQMQWMFRAYAERRRAELESLRATRDGQYWADKFNTLPPAPVLPRPAQRPDAARRALWCRFNRWTTLREITATQMVEPFVALLTCFLETLVEQTGSRQFTVVVPRWDRPADCDRVIGEFTRLSWIGCPAQAADFWSQARAVQQVLDADAGHSSVSGLSALRKTLWANHAGRHGGFPVVCTDLISVPPGCTAAMRRGLTRTPGVALDALFFELPDGKLGIRWDFDADRCEPGTAARLFRQFKRRLDCSLAGGTPVFRKDGAPSGQLSRQSALAASAP